MHHIIRLIIKLNLFYFFIIFYISYNMIFAIHVFNIFNITTCIFISTLFITLYLSGYFGLLFLVSLVIGIEAFIIFLITYPEEYVYILEKYMNHHENEQIIISSNKQYYTYRGIHYDIAFPIYRVINETPQSGPHHCQNCKEHGMFRGVFIMYCHSCAKYIYDNQVGYGALESGVEYGGPLTQKSAWNTYLKHRDLTKIGLSNELRKINFHRQGYKYRILCKKNKSGEIIQWYPDFIKNEDYISSDDDDYEQYYENNHHHHEKSEEEEYRTNLQLRMMSL